MATLQQVAPVSQYGVPQLSPLARLPAGRDLQLMTDVILSRGMPGRWPPPAGAPPVEVFFSNPDML